VTGVSDIFADATALALIRAPWQIRFPDRRSTFIFVKFTLLDGSFLIKTRPGSKKHHAQPGKGEGHFGAAPIVDGENYFALTG